MKPCLGGTGLDPGGAIFETMIHGNVDHLDRVYDVCDIIGFNYYYSQAPGPLSLLAEPYRRGQNFTMMRWRIDPDGLYKEIKRVGDRYGKPMMITENGIATPDDVKRVWYMRNHVAAIGRCHSRWLRRSRLFCLVACRQL